MRNCQSSSQVGQAAVDTGAAECRLETSIRLDLFSLISSFSSTSMSLSSASAPSPPASFICCAQLCLSHSFFLTFSCTSAPPPRVPKHASTPGLCPFTQLLWGHVRSFICKVTGCAFPPLQDTEFCQRRNRSFRPGRVLRLAEHGPNCSWITLSRY